MTPAEQDTAAEAEDRDERPLERGIFCDLSVAYAGIETERSWFVEGAIENNPVVLLVGPEKKGKSWMLADLAVAVASGTKWLGAFQANRAGKALVLDGEYGPHEYARRLARLARGRGLDPEEVFGNVLYVFAVPLLLSKENAFYLQVLQEVSKREPDVVVVDPLRNFVDGDENSTQDALEAYRNLVRFRHGCPVVAAHHLNKRGEMSGARAFKTRADMLIEGTDEEQPWYSTVGRCIRASDPIANRFTVRIDHEHDEDDRRAATRLSVRFEGESAPRSALSAPARRLLEELKSRSAAASLNALGKAANVNGGSVKSRAMQELADAGLATKGPRGWELTTPEFFASIAPSSGGGR